MMQFARDLRSRLTQPHISVMKSVKGEEVKSTITFVLLLLILNSLIAVVTYVVFQRWLIEILLMEVVLIFAYLLSRSRASALVGAVLSIGSSIAVFVNMIYATDPLLGFIWCMFPISMAMLFLPVWAAILLIAIDYAGILLLFDISPDISRNTMVSSAIYLVYMLFVNLLSKIALAKHQDALEQRTAALVDSQVRELDLYSDLPIGLYVTTPDGRILDANPACIQLLDLQRDESGFVENAGSFYKDPERRLEWEAMLLKQGYVSKFDSQFCLPDGRTIWIRENTRILYDESGNIRAYRGSIEDITEHVQTLNNLEQRTQALATLNALANDLSSSSNLDKLIEEALARAVDTLEFSGGLISLVDSDSGNLELHSHINLPEGMPDHIRETKFRCPLCEWVLSHSDALYITDLNEGAPVDVSMLINSGILSYAGTPIVYQKKAIGTLCLFGDTLRSLSDMDGALLRAIGEQIGVAFGRAQLFSQLEATRDKLLLKTDELVHANEHLEELSRLKSDFLANMSHELRTPLNAILGFSQLMMRSPTLSEDDRTDLQTIHQSGAHLLALINDVLDMSKIEAGRVTYDPEDVDLYTLLDNVMSMISNSAAEKALQLDYSCSSEVPQFIQTDERKLRQVLLNLLGNAIKFTPTGHVTLRVRGPEADQQVLHFEVEDTGMGVSPDEMGALFDPFTQTSSGKKVQGGTGLGLPISQRYVRLMGGDLDVESQLGEGSTFRFDIEFSPSEDTFESTDTLEEGGRYRSYGESGDSIAETSESTQEPSTVSVALPDGWVAQLHDAATRARGDLVMELVDEIKDENPVLAETIEQLVDDFRFDEIPAVIPIA